MRCSTPPTTHYHHRTTADLGTSAFSDPHPVLYRLLKKCCILLPRPGSVSRQPAAYSPKSVDLCAHVITPALLLGGIFSLLSIFHTYSPSFNRCQNPNQAYATRIMRTYRTDTPGSKPCLALRFLRSTRNVSQATGCTSRCRRARVSALTLSVWAWRVLLRK